jgi:DNA integrity scanning protein DisA with diadenylate cyclase activity
METKIANTAAANATLKPGGTLPTHESLLRYRTAVTTLETMTGMGILTARELAAAREKVAQKCGLSSGSILR